MNSAGEVAAAASTNASRHGGVERIKEITANDS